MLGDLVRENRGFVPAVNRRLYELIDAGWTEERVRAYDGTDDGGEYPNHPFRVSDLHRLCPRMVALARREPIRYVYRVEDLWNFAAGKAYHDAIHQALAELPRGVFRGWWESADRGAIEKAQALQPELCAVPATHLTKRQRELGVAVVCGDNLASVARPSFDADWTYVEMLLLDDERMLRGHMDGDLIWAPNDKEVLEIKSTATFQADHYNPQRGGAPKDDHVIQDHGYMLLAERERARTVYLVKASGGLNMVMMEHVVERDEALIGGIELLLKECKAALALGPEDPLPDPLAACDKKSRKRPGKCPAKKRCFECRK